jgi:hypothetical protein
MLTFLVESKGKRKSILFALPNADLNLYLLLPNVFTVSGFPVPSRDVTYQTLPGRE